MTIETIGAIVLGWLLGLLSPAIVNSIQRHYRRKEIQQGIITELTDLRFRIATAAWRFESRFGTCDRTLINWFIQILESYKGATDTTQFLERTKNLSMLNDTALSDYAASQKANPGDGLGVKKYRLPYLDANIGELGLFDEKSRAAILDVRAQLDLFNEEVDSARSYHKMTFELGDTDNHAIAVLSVETCYKNLGRKAKHIADRIGPILEE
jgi:hypothetical protein